MRYRCESLRLILLEYQTFYFFYSVVVENSIADSLIYLHILIKEYHIVQNFEL